MDSDYDYKTLLSDPWKFDIDKYNKLKYKESEYTWKPLKIADNLKDPNRRYKFQLDDLPRQFNLTGREIYKNDDLVGCILFNITVDNKIVVYHIEYLNTKLVSRDMLTELFFNDGYDDITYNLRMN